jgi:hypothetical protein
MLTFNLLLFAVLVSTNNNNHNNKQQSLYSQNLFVLIGENNKKYKKRAGLTQRSTQLTHTFIHSSISAAGRLSHSAHFFG